MENYIICVPILNKNKIMIFLEKDKKIKEVCFDDYIIINYDGDNDILFFNNNYFYEAGIADVEKDIIAYYSEEGKLNKVDIKTNIGVFPIYQILNNDEVEEISKHLVTSIFNYYIENLKNLSRNQNIKCADLNYFFDGQSVAIYFEYYTNENDESMEHNYEGMIELSEILKGELKCFIINLELNAQYNGFDLLIKIVQKLSDKFSMVDYVQLGIYKDFVIRKLNILD